MNRSHISRPTRQQQQQQFFHQVESQNAPSPGCPRLRTKQSHRHQQQQLQQKITSHGSQQHGNSIAVSGDGAPIPAVCSRSAKRTRNTATTAAASTPDATWTTTTRTAATTATFPQIPRYRHVAHRLAASYMNRNTQHDRDDNNLANHKEPTTARTALATAQQTQKLKQARKTNLSLTSN